jgi:dimethylaniline monooxygenase (N-oxide forming)
MEREIARVHAWADEVFPGRSQGYFVGPFVAHYIDELMRDMRLETRRTPHLLLEYFGTFRPSRYRDVGRERRQARLSDSAPDGPRVGVPERNADERNEEWSRHANVKIQAR